MYHAHFGLERGLFGEGIAADAAVFRSPKHDRLIAHFKLALASPSSGVVLRGPAGVGKTHADVGRAAREQHAARARVAQRHADERRRAARAHPRRARHQHAAHDAHRAPAALAAIPSRDARDRIAPVRRRRAHRGSVAPKCCTRSTQLTAPDAAGNPGANFVLLGHAGIDEHLAAPVLDSLRQRIRLRAELEPFTEAELQDYLRHQVACAGGHLRSDLRARHRRRAVSLLAAASRGSRTRCARRALDIAASPAAEAADGRARDEDGRVAARPRRSGAGARSARRGRACTGAAVRRVVAPHPPSSRRTVAPSHPRPPCTRSPPPRRPPPLRRASRGTRRCCASARRCAVAAPRRRRRRRASTAAPPLRPCTAAVAGAHSAPALRRPAPAPTLSDLPPVRAPAAHRRARVRRRRDRHHRRRDGGLPGPDGRRRAAAGAAASAPANARAARAPSAAAAEPAAAAPTTAGRKAAPRRARPLPRRRPPAAKPVSSRVETAYAPSKAPAGPRRAAARCGAEADARRRRRRARRSRSRRRRRAAPNANDARDRRREIDRRHLELDGRNVVRRRRARSRDGGARLGRRMARRRRAAAPAPHADAAAQPPTARGTAPRTASPPKAAPPADDDPFDLFGLGDDAPLELIDDSTLPPTTARARPRRAEQRHVRRDAQALARRRAGLRAARARLPALREQLVELALVGVIVEHGVELLARLHRVEHARAAFRRARIAS